MNRVNCLVTGANGFIGYALCSHLTNQEFRVKSATRGKSFVQTETENIVIGDINGDSDWESALNGVDVVVHLASHVPSHKADGKDSLTEFKRTNVEGTLNLANQAAANGVKRLVYLSTIKVNGEQTKPGHAFCETDLPAPQDIYGITKYEAEIALANLAEQTGMEIVTIRAPLVYGPGVKGNFATLVRWVKRGIPLPLGSVSNLRSMVALENLIDFIALCADREKSPLAANQTFLISDGEDVSITELLIKVANAYGVKSRLIPVPEMALRLIATLTGQSGTAGRLLDSLMVDSSKARTLLGWTPKVTIDEQLRIMAQNA